MHADTGPNPPPAKGSKLKLPAGVRVGGAIVRVIFILILAVVTARVASPQRETMRSVFETPGDVVRVGLGFAVCAWLIVNLFILPKDAEAYRTWLYMGIALLPLSLLCAIMVW